MTGGAQKLYTAEEHEKNVLEMLAPLCSLPRVLLISMCTDAIFSNMKASSFPKTVITLCNNISGRNHVSPSISKSRDFRRLVE
jgi:hypothetical protein